MSEGFCWLGQERKEKSKSPKKAKKVARLKIFGHWDPQSKEVKAISAGLFDWQRAAFDSPAKVLKFDTSDGPLWIIRPQENLKSKSKKSKDHHYGMIDVSPFAFFRNESGSIVGSWTQNGVDLVEVEFIHGNPEIESGVVTGLELGAYRYRRPEKLPEVRVSKWSSKELWEKASLGRAVNLARDLVNTPADRLNPKTYSEKIHRIFSKSSHIKVETWDPARLKKERCGLILAVGRGAEEGPRLVRISYRGPGAGKKSPMAWVGKGMTFDSGGLNVKVGSGMRLMKKDMGGSAALVGACAWLAENRLPLNCDFYLALAENSIDGRSYRPGDIIQSRKGVDVEIDNTDAEGRLVLADALDVAINQKGKDKPDRVIDVATLTGAAKVAVGADLAALFSNHDPLADRLLHAGQRAGDYAWRLPLYEPYFQMLKTPVAYMKNSSESGYAGSITAALFLKEFVGDMPWAHLDIYGWQDSPGGAIGERGASGQAVQMIVEYWKASLKG